MGKAHENINQEIILDTIKRIKHAQHGNWMEGLFEAQTKGGDTRYIHRTQGRYPNQEAWQDMFLNLLTQIKENPQYADTVASKDLSGVKEGMDYWASPSIMDRLINKIKSAFSGK